MINQFQLQCPLCPFCDVIIQAAPPQQWVQNASITQVYFIILLETCSILTFQSSSRFDSKSLHHMKETRKRKWSHLCNSLGFEDASKQCHYLSFAYCNGDLWWFDRSLEWLFEDMTNSDCYAHQVRLSTEMALNSSWGIRRNILSQNQLWSNNKPEQFVTCNFCYFLLLHHFAQCLNHLNAAGTCNGLLLYHLKLVWRSDSIVDINQSMPNFYKIPTY